MLKKMIEEIREQHILPDSVNQWRELKGGTNSTVGVMGTMAIPHMYVVKSNTPEQIKAESLFYQIYDSISLLPKTKYVDPEHQYFIYEFVSGDSQYNRGSKQELMSQLIERMIQHYVIADESVDFEWVEDPARIEEDRIYSESFIGSHLTEEDHRMVKDIHMRRISRVSKEKHYVLHGDFGVHNFLFENGTLSGVIDPLPKVGRPRYDLLYAFCSSPDELHLNILLNSVEQLDSGPFHTQELIEDMIAALYFRIATCLLHHPEDLQLYLKAWEEWKQHLAKG
ncbi:hypothetical protein FHS15_005136 [Paenibacillus castaneae]|uniref:aminoglycoside phosphotransferase n=1 Tax=Paenibacillus castaneae TaxID=474957 RepID=UPI000C9C96E1|nr:aminoglycoside phosphotransferase [Paenibacillus castaneae]NIK79962.1 hypothetical protein [Paenibacillus castaneae]